MKRTLDILRFTVISPEVAVILIVCALFSYCPSWFTIIGEKLKLNNEISTGLFLSPLAALAWTFKESKLILLPQDDNKILLNWEDYPMVRNRVFLGLGLLVVCVISSIVTLLIKEDLSTEYYALTFLLIFGVLGVVVVTHSLAAVSIRQILEKDG